MFGTVSVKSSIYAALTFLAVALLFSSGAEMLPGLMGCALREVIGVLEDPGTQWVVFAFLGIYAGTFLVLRLRSRFRHLSGSGWSQLMRRDGAGFWIIAVLAICVFNYARHYSPSIRALIFLGGAVIGQGIIAWSGYEVKQRTPQFRNRLWFAVITLLVILLAVGSVWQVAMENDFDYRGTARWCGPWGNPNIYGLLMAAGVLLAAGQLMQFFIAPKREGVPVRPFQMRLPFHAALAACFVAAIFLGRGLFHSYSRGAWLGTGCGAAYLAGTVFWLPATGPCECRWWKRLTGWIMDNWRPLLLIAVSALALCFWHFRQSDSHAVRRAFSAANSEDFSWRNRVSAWVGTLQITADNPWLGAGWDRPEALYENYYLPSRLENGKAIQMNDYLVLVASLGVPAFFCFGMYLWRSLTWRLRRPARAPKESAVDSEPRCQRFDALQATCRAGAIVMLVGFWFDGGMFWLPTAATFWALLELGGMGSHHLWNFAKEQAAVMVVKVCPRRRLVSRGFIPRPRPQSGSRLAGRRAGARPLLVECRAHRGSAGAPVLK